MSHATADPTTSGALAEDDTYLAGKPQAIGARVHAGYSQVTIGRHQDAGEHLDGGGLPRAVGSDVPHHLATLDLERQLAGRSDLGTATAQCARLAAYDEGLAHVADIDDGVRHC
jgi:hypothetical protein